MRLTFLFPAAALFLSACGGGPPEPSAGVPRVVATTGMIADIVREVAGPLAEVTALMGEGVDPHLYKPSAADVKAINGADLVFYNGLMLEGKMVALLEKLAASGREIRAVTEPFVGAEGYVMIDDERNDDPHVWMDVKAWIAALGVVERIFVERYPDNAETYRANAAAYRETLETLDDYARRSLATIPEEQRVLVTAHDAFQYMSRAYGIEVRGIQGLSTESEAGVRDIENLVNFLVERRIPAVFVESSVSDKSVLALVEGAAAKGHKVAIGGELFSDALGPKGTYEGSYVGMIDHNVTTIVRALGGEVPPGGLQDRLAAKP